MADFYGTCTQLNAHIHEIYIYIYICAIYVWILEVLQEAIRQSCKTLECTVKSKNGAILSYCHDGKKLKDHQVSFNSFAE